VLFAGPQKRPPPRGMGRRGGEKLNFFTLRGRKKKKGAGKRLQRDRPRRRQKKRKVSSIKTVILNGLGEKKKGGTRGCSKKEKTCELSEKKREEKKTAGDNPCAKEKEKKKAFSSMKEHHWKEWEGGAWAGSIR